MEHFDVIVIGGGATGTGILRDLAMRGVKTLLLEQRDLAYGTSSRFHGLLHSGGRYAVKDPEAARECIEENRILRRIAPFCVEETEGLFVRTRHDAEEYEEIWQAACRQQGIEVVRLSLPEVLKQEANLSPDIQAVYRVPDAAVDGFRLVWQNVESARRYGAVCRTYTEVIGIEQEIGRVCGVKTRDTLTGEERNIACDMIVNAAGCWVGKVAALASACVRVAPDRGSLIAFNHRLSNRVVNRLRPPADADIFVPHGSITILGTTSVPTNEPDDFEVETEEVLQQLREGEALFHHLADYRILRVFSGTRPIYDPGGAGRGATRNFAIVDHQQTEGLGGFISIVGGKLTTYRLMAEKTADVVCRQLGNTKICRTAEEPLLPAVSSQALAEARRYLPAYGTSAAVSRLGPRIGEAVEKIKENAACGQLVCECELVTLAEVEIAAEAEDTHTLDDLRRKTRMGMGSCQGVFCSLRSVGVLSAHAWKHDVTPRRQLREFLEARWSGIRPVLWGNQLREIELARAVYGATLHIEEVAEDEN